MERYSMQLEKGCRDADNSFGPAVPVVCRGGFDFTLLFEQAILDLLPATLFICAVAFRIKRLTNSKTFNGWTCLLIAKMITAAVYFSSQFTLLVFWSKQPEFTNRISLAASIANFIASVMLLLVSYLEHVRSVRPSLLLGTCLPLSLLFDAAQCRTLWLISRGPISITFLIATLVKTLMAFFEACPKPKQLDETSPEVIAGVYSLRTFWWLRELFSLGYRKSLDPRDLYALEPDIRASENSPQLIIRWRQVDPRKRHALFITLTAAFRNHILAPVIGRILVTVFNYSQPFLIRRVIGYVQNHGQEDSPNAGYGLIGATLFTYCGIAVSNGYYGYQLYRANMLVRGGLVDLIYHKTLRLDIQVAEKAAPLGLITSDIDRIVLTLEKFHELWACILETGIALYLLNREIGVACIAPAVIAILCTIANSFVAKAIPKRQKRWNQSIQTRIAMTSSALKEIKSVKMMGLSGSISKILQQARIVELDTSKGFRMWVAFMNTVVIVPRHLSGPFAFLIFLWVPAFPTKTLTSAQAFAALSIIELLTNPLGKALQSLPSITASFACLDRIQDYLALDERNECRILGTATLKASKENKKNVADQNATELQLLQPETLVSRVVLFSNVDISYKSREESVLKDLTLEVMDRTLTMIIGPVGCGKTSLLKAILGELHITKGRVVVGCREIAYCGQRLWLTNKTIRQNIIGETGSDSTWYDTVIWSCALDEDIALLPEGSDTVVGSSGISLSEGQRQRVALARAVYSRKRLLLLDDTLSAVDAQTQRSICIRLLSREGLLYKHNRTVMLTTHSIHHLSIADQVLVLNDSGSIEQLGKFEELASEQGYVQQQLTELKSKGSQLESHIEKDQQPVSSQSSSTPRVNPTNAELHRGAGDRAALKFYLKSIGAHRVAVLIMAAMMLAFGTRFTYIWIQWWTESGSSKNTFYMIIYFALAIGSLLSYAFLFCWMMVIIVPISASRIHWQLLEAVLGAKLSFFTSVDFGSILNRFGQDMSFMNAQVPITVYQAVSTLFMCLMQMALIAIGSKYMFAFVPVTLAVVWILQRVYLRTSRQLRLLDLELRAPLYSSLTDAIEGLVTIRALGWGPQFERHNHSRVDASQRPVYLLYMVQRWLNFVLDLIAAALAVILVTFATQLRSTSQGAALGVSMVNILGFSQTLSQFIFYYTDMETFMGSVTRVKEYVEELEPESHNDGNSEIPAEWSEKGDITFENVNASYSGTANPVLKDICLTVATGQKVCICGRTGSGKSSLMATILKVTERSGTVEVNGMDISMIPTEELRRWLVTIPQTPVILPGSVRFNMSLLNSASDEEIVAALQKAQLWNIVSARGGLNGPMSGLDLSYGQQQLFSLARAMLRTGRILLLDEAMSSVDFKTEELMHSIIQEHFQGFTVISIAHRLRACMSYDMCIVLSKGSILEIGRPSELLELRGKFWELWKSQS